MNENGSMPTEPQVVAVPKVYIDVTIAGRKQVYEVATAEELRDELTRALNLLDQQGAEKIPRKPRLPTRRDQERKIGDEGYSVAAAASRQEA